MALGDEHDPPALREPLANLCDRTGGVPAIGGRWFRSERERGWLPIAVVFRRTAAGPIRVASRGKRRNRPPGQLPARGQSARLGDRPDRGPTQVDRHLAARRCGDPGGLEELLTRGDEV